MGCARHYRQKTSTCAEPLREKGENRTLEGASRGSRVAKTKGTKKVNHIVRDRILPVDAARCFRYLPSRISVPTVPTHHRVHERCGIRILRLPSCVGCRCCCFCHLLVVKLLVLWVPDRNIAGGVRWVRWEGAAHAVRSPSTKYALLSENKTQNMPNHERVIQKSDSVRPTRTRSNGRMLHNLMSVRAKGERTGNGRKSGWSTYWWKGCAWWRLAAAAADSTAIDGSSSTGVSLASDNGTILFFRPVLGPRIRVLGTFSGCGRVTITTAPYGN
jgi:hypothetical protein